MNTYGRWYMKPLEQTTNETIADELAKRNWSNEPYSLEYRGKKIEDLYRVDLDFIHYWEKSIKDGGNKWFKVELYLKNTAGTVFKYKFPRNRKVRTALEKIAIRENKKKK